LTTLSYDNTTKGLSPESHPLVVMVYNGVESRQYKNFFQKNVLLIILLFFLPGCQTRVVPLTPAGTTLGAQGTVLRQREYIVHQQLTLVNKGPGQPEKQNLWWH